MAGLMIAACCLGEQACVCVRLCVCVCVVCTRAQMNPIATLYHIAPCCFVFLALPFTYMELPRMFNDPKLAMNWQTGGLLLISAIAAFGEIRKHTHMLAHQHSLRAERAQVSAQVLYVPKRLTTCVCVCVCVCVAALNMSVFLLIGKTSALTMNVAGVVKDWLLILLSVVLYG